MPLYDRSSLAISPSMMLRVASLALTPRSVPAPRGEADSTWGHGGPKGDRAPNRRPPPQKTALKTSTFQGDDARGEKGLTIFEKGTNLF